MIVELEELRRMPTTQLICIMVYMQLLLDPDHTKTPIILEIRAATPEERADLWLLLVMEIDRRLPQG